MDKDQLDGLLALKTVAEKQSFKAAAEQLRISPPAISKIINLLEERMGVTLLMRTTRSVRLSEAGLLFLNQVGPAIEKILAAQEEIKTFGQTPSGVLKLNMPGIFYPFYLSPYVDSFLKEHPLVTVEILSDDQVSDIFERGYDAGVRTDDILAKDLVAFKMEVSKGF